MCMRGMLKEWCRVMFRSELSPYGGMFVVLYVPFVYAYGLAAFRRRSYMFHP